jgi:hypothetical protein
MTEDKVPPVFMISIFLLIVLFLVIYCNKPLPLGGIGAIVIITFGGKIYWRESRRSEEK